MSQAHMKIKLRNRYNICSVLHMSSEATIQRMDIYFREISCVGYSLTYNFYWET